MGLVVEAAGVAGATEAAEAAEEADEDTGAAARGSERLLGIAALAGAAVAEADAELPLTAGASEPAGLNASMRSNAMAKPVCSSGARDKSGRLVILI